MVDVSAKPETHRVARATGRIRLQPANASMAPIYADDVVVLGRIVGVFRRIP